MRLNAKKIFSTMLATVITAGMVTVSPLTAFAASITTAEGWYEAAHVEWSGSSGAKVEYKLSSSSSWTTVNSALVRGTVCDIPGLKGNATYNIRVDGSATATVTTKKFTREGFAFSSKSPNGTTTGGYQSDGTAASNATILHITNSNKDSVTLDVVTNSKGTTTSCKGIGAILQARQKGYDTTPLIIRFIGTVSAPSGADSNSLLNIKKTKNVTAEGVGSDALCSGWGFNVRNASNIEIRNLGFKDFPDDSVSVQTDNNNIWIHHNDFMIGKNGGGDKSKGDGSCDLKDDSTYVTVDYNDFQNTGKSSLCGMKSETTGAGFVTYHHNWFNKSGSRHPRVRTMTVHVYNNYFDHCYSAGIAACMGSSVFAENNYFCGVVRPIIAASQGNSLKSDGDDFCSGEDGGVIKSYGNTFANCGKSYTYLDSKLNSTTATCAGQTYFNGGSKSASGSAASYPDCYYKTN